MSAMFMGCGKEEYKELKSYTYPNGDRFYNPATGEWYYQLRYSLESDVNIKNITENNKKVEVRFVEGKGLYTTQPLISLANAFVGKNFNDPDISNWNTMHVRDMSMMFFLTTNFNQDISGFNTSEVTNMSAMFKNASSFNQDISRWDVSNVTDMTFMFNSTQAFNQDISRWDVSNVTEMQGMFDNTSSFNQDISKWNVSKVTNMMSMFAWSKSFNQDISRWNVSKVRKHGNFDVGSNPSWTSDKKPRFNN